MAAASRTSGAPAEAAAPTSEVSEGPAVIVTPVVQPGPTAYIVVGAGGNGARVVPPLSQMTKRGDTVIVMDHDIVEDRNLRRQHFTQRDIGLPKAMVLATRYQRPEFPILAYESRIEVGRSVENLIGQIQADSRARQFIFIGCVDNAAARRGLKAAVDSITHNIGGNVAWVDVGNETRGGQVLLTARWGVKVQVLRPVTQTLGTGHYVLDGMAKAMPQLLRDAPGASAESCGDRVDMQTVQVNAMAASVALNTVSWLTLGLPFASCGAFFSTLNTMQPIKLAKVVGGQILPEDSFAIAVE